jgi:hypothetical protein
MDEFVTGLAQTKQVALDSHFAVVQYDLCVINSFSTEGGGGGKIQCCHCITKLP